jgi:hypothetical protein
MTLDRYNKIAIAVVSTTLLLALFIFGIFLGSNLFTRHETPGIVIGHAGRPKSKQVLVTCLPAYVSGSEFEYFPVAAVVIHDADEAPVVAAKSLVSGSYSPGRFGEACRFDEYGGSGRVFNVVVKNTSTGEERLLLKESAQVVSLTRPDAKCEEGAGDVPCATLLWTIRPADSNKDGIIDGRDAEVEFVSDLRASKLIQVTPSDSTSLSNIWLNKGNKLLFQIRRDANGDGRFTDEDGAEIIEVDLAYPTIGVSSLNADTINNLSSAIR